MPLQTLQAVLEKTQLLEGRQDTHEAICTERYEAARASTEELKATLAKITDRLTSISDAQIASASAAAAVAAAALTNTQANQPKWWQRLVFAAALAVFGWMASTIWSMEAAKVDAAQNRPATQVTVQPAQSAPVQPIAQPTAPAPGTPPSALSDDPPTN